MGQCDESGLLWWFQRWLFFYSPPHHHLSVLFLWYRSRLLMVAVFFFIFYLLINNTLYFLTLVKQVSSCWHLGHWVIPPPASRSSRSLPCWWETTMKHVFLRVCPSSRSRFNANVGQRQFPCHRAFSSEVERLIFVLHFIGSSVITVLAKQTRVLTVQNFLFLQRSR